MIVDGLITPGIVAGGIRDMARSKDGMSHFVTRRTAVDRYQGVGIREDVRRYFAAQLLEEITVDTLPVASKVIDSRYSVYRSAPERSYSVDMDPSVWGNRDLMMPVWERLTGLLGTEALVVGVEGEVDDDGGVTGDHLTFSLLTEFEPIFSGTDPEPMGYAYPVYASRKLESKDQEWECWTSDVRFRVRGDGVLVSEELNPYGAIPIVVAHRGTALGSSWWRPIADDVLTAQVTYNVLGTQHNAGLLFQALGQPVATGVLTNDTLRTGPNQVVKMNDPQSRFEIIAPPGNLAQLIDAQRWKMDALCFRYGIKAKWAADGGATSGEHQRLLEIELSNAVGSDFAGWRNVERHLHEVCRRVAAQHGLGDLGDLLSVDFAEPNVPPSPAELREQWEFEYSKGLATKKDYFKLTNPDISDEQVQAKLDEVAAERTVDPTVERPAPTLATLLAAPTV